MGVCYSCNKLCVPDADEERAASRAVEERIRQIRGDPRSEDFHTPKSGMTSVGYSRSPFIETRSQISSQRSARSFQFPSNSARPSESAHTSEVERFHFGAKQKIEPGMRAQSGVFKIPNQFSPLNSPISTSPTTTYQGSGVMSWGVPEVVSWWCEKLPDEAIQYAPLVEDTQLKGEDLMAMDLELLMSFQIDRPLAEHILMEIHALANTSHSRNETILSTSTMTTNDSQLHAREHTFMSNTITSTTGETQVFSDPECDSLPSFWNAVGIPEEAGTDNECENIRSPLTLLPPNSPRMVAEAESMSSDRIAQLEQQIQSLQDQLEKQSRPCTPVGKRNNANKDKTQRGVAKGRRKNKVTSKRRTKDKFSVYKEGPIDIGRMTDWSPARYDIVDDGKAFTEERLNIGIKYKQYHVYKQGPRDVGTVRNWKPYRHNREDSGRDFLAERIPRSKAQDKSERKEGPRGRPEVRRKRSSCRKEGEKTKNQGSSRKNSTRSGSRKNSARSASRKNSGRSASRKNSERSRKNTGDRRNYQPRSQSRPRTTQQEVLSLSPNDDISLRDLGLALGPSRVLAVYV